MIFAAFLAIFVLAVAVDIFLSAAIIYHLLKFALPGRNAARIVIPAYLALAAIFFGLALYSFLAIPFSHAR